MRFYGRFPHMLFEVADRSFSQTVTEERLMESRRLMRGAPERLIAGACGFESLATYYESSTPLRPGTP